MMNIEKQENKKKKRTVYITVASILLAVIFIEWLDYRLSPVCLEKRLQFAPNARMHPNICMFPISVCVKPAFYQHYTSRLKQYFVISE